MDEQDYGQYSGTKEDSGKFPESNMTRWNNNFQRLKDFKEQYGIVKVTKGDDDSLNKWLSIQKYHMKLVIRYH